MGGYGHGTFGHLVVGALPFDFSVCMSGTHLGGLPMVVREDSSRRG